MNHKVRVTISACIAMLFVFTAFFSGCSGNQTAGSTDPAKTLAPMPAWSDVNPDDSLLRGTLYESLRKFYESASGEELPSSSQSDGFTLLKGIGAIPPSIDDASSLKDTVTKEEFVYSLVQTVKAVEDTREVVLLPAVKPDAKSFSVSMSPWAILSAETAAEIKELAIDENFIPGDAATNKQLNGALTYFYQSLQNIVSNNNSCTPNENETILTEQERDSWESDLIQTQETESGDRLTFKNTNAIARDATEGSIIILDSSITGEAVKITGKTQDGQGNTVLDVAPPSLGELVGDMKLNVKKDLTPDDICYQSFADGCSFAPSPQLSNAAPKIPVISLANAAAAPITALANESSNDFTLKMDFTVDLDDNEESQIKVSGEIGFKDMIVRAVAENNKKSIQSLIDMPGLDQVGLSVSYDIVNDLSISILAKKSTELKPKDDTKKPAFFQGIDLSNKYILGVVAFQLTNLSIPRISAKWDKNIVPIGAVIYFSMTLDGEVSAEVKLAAETHEYQSLGFNVQRNGYEGKDGPFIDSNYSSVTSVGEFKLGIFSRKMYSREEPGRLPETILKLEGSLNCDAKLLFEPNIGILIFGILPVNASLEIGFQLKGNVKFSPISVVFEEGKPAVLDFDMANVEGELKLDFLYGIRAEARLKVRDKHGFDMELELPRTSEIFNICNKSADSACSVYSAYDGKNVFYLTNKTINRISDSGENTAVASGEIVQFVGIGASGLYYLERDSSYQPQGAEQDLQFCTSYNLMKLDPKDNTSAKVAGPVASCTMAIGGVLYATDHNNHGNVLAINLESGATESVAGVADAISQNGGQEGYVMALDQQAFYVCQKGSTKTKYQLNGNRLAAGVSSQPSMDDIMQEASYLVYYADDITLQKDIMKRTVSIKVGDGFKKLDLTDVEAVIPSGKKAYIATMTKGGAVSEEKTNAKLTLYSVDITGQLIKLYEKDTYQYEYDTWNVIEVAGNRVFYYACTGLEGEGFQAELVVQDTIA